MVQEFHVPDIGLGLSRRNLALIRNPVLVLVRSQLVLKFVLVGESVAIAIVAGVVLGVCAIDGCAKNTNVKAVETSSLPHHHQLFLRLSREIYFFENSRRLIWKSFDVLTTDGFE